MLNKQDHVTINRVIIEFSPTVKDSNYNMDDETYNEELSKVKQLDIVEGPIQSCKQLQWIYSMYNSIFPKTRRT